MNLYKEIGQEFYYIEKGDYGTYFMYSSHESEKFLREGITQAEKHLDESIKARRKTMRSTPVKHPHRFELIGEVDSVCDIIAILQLLE